MKTLIASAGGKNSRIRDFLHDHFQEIPKHLLPIPGRSKSLIQEIIDNALRHFDSVIISTNEANRPVFQSIFCNNPRVKVEIDSFATGPLGPMIRWAIKKGTRVYGCAGDFYCDFSWEEFEKFHDSHLNPISILIAPSTPAPKGAKFIVRQGIIDSWERVPFTSNDDHINIGCYIMDPRETVIKLLETMKEHKEDLFFDIFIASGLISPFVQKLGFNVNTPGTYEQMAKLLV